MYISSDQDPTKRYIKLSAIIKKIRERINEEKANKEGDTAVINLIIVACRLE